MSLKIYRYNLEHPDEAKQPMIVEPLDVEKERAKKREQRKAERLAKRKQKTNGQEFRNDKDELWKIKMCVDDVLRRENKVQKTKGITIE